MNLIVEIPDEQFNAICSNKTIWETEPKSVIYLAIANGTPLDDIRQEINDLPKTYPFINHIDTYVKTDDVIRIIDRHIGNNDAEWYESEPLDDVVELMKGESE